MFTKDEADKVNCSGGCLTAWPPLIVEGAPKAGEGVDQAMLGTATMTDGRKIVTYNHMPLYYWAGDTKAGDTTGNGVEGFSIATIGGSGAAPKASAPAPAAPAAPPASSSGGKYGY
jgi:predicted lipoprotein with Yx(FWY)xxD motif